MPLFLRHLLDHPTLKQLTTKLRSLWHSELRKITGRSTADIQASGTQRRTQEVRYWDGIAQLFKQKPHYLDEFLGTLKRQTHLALIERWGGIPTTGRVLKTDLFEEAMGPDALLEGFVRTENPIVGIDVALATATRASERNGKKSISYVTADVRRLPFSDNSFALVVSPSTLDHFPDPEDLGHSLREIRRLLTADGRLIITLDNRQNIFDPLLRLVNRLGLTPYYLGRSYSIDELCAELEAVGFTVEEKTAILHNPRLVAVAMVKVADALNWPPLTRLLHHGLLTAQHLEHTRWRYFTGSFIAVKAVRRNFPQ